MITTIALVVWCVFCLVDGILYGKVTKKHGFQFKFWPGSGIYLWWKLR